MSNPSHLVLSYRLLVCLGVSCLLLLQTAGADSLTRDDQVSQNSNHFGVVWRIKGDVTATSADNKVHALREGISVYVGESIHTSKTGEAVIKSDDGGVVGIRPGTDFLLEQFSAEGKKTDHMVLRLLQGSLRVITGWIGQVNRGGEKIVTPTATIGIRGTDHEPYVLTADMASGTEYKAGTYDKVNRGKTSLGEVDNSLEIEPGRVGFARQPKFSAKGLMTILMPVLLDKVPSFYVPGQFDSELDQYTQTADTESAKLLESRKGKRVSACVPSEIAKDWIGRFDAAVVRLDAQTIMSLFASDVTVTANVRDQDGKMVAVEVTRDEMAQSTVAAVKGLKNYRQRRLTLESRAAEGGACKRVSVSSNVIEQGVQSGKPYRIESKEEYLLEQRDGSWLAIKAETTQR